MPHFEGKTGYRCSCPDGTCDMNCRMYRIVAGKPSNADRIRAMTDEELARYLAKVSRDAGVRCDGLGIWTKPQIAGGEHISWLEWLKQEVDDGQG